MNNKISALNFSTAGDQFLGTSYEVMDCQAFVEACMKQVGINMDLAGSNAWYRRMTWVGSPEECKAKFGTIPKGAILYILEKSGKEPEQYKHDGIGNASHMGIYIGRLDGAIHSSKSRGGVCYSKFSGSSINGGWNRVGLWDRFDYGDKINAMLGGNVTGKPEVNTEVLSMDMSNAVVRSSNGAGVNLRSDKSVNSKLVTAIPEGAAIYVLENDGTWCTVQYQDKSGYAMSKFITYVEVPSATIPNQTSGEPIIDFGSLDGITYVQMEKSVALKLYDALGAALAGQVIGHG